MIKLSELGWPPAIAFLVVMLVLSALAIWWLVREHGRRNKPF